MCNDCHWFRCRYIEKHVTFNNNSKGPDHQASLKINKFSEMVKQIRNIELSLGTVVRKLKSEKQNRVIARNSIVANKIIKKMKNFLKQIFQLRDQVMEYLQNFYQN